MKDHKKRAFTSSSEAEDVTKVSKLHGTKNSVHHEPRTADDSDQKTDRPGFDLSGSSDDTHAGSGLGLGQDAFDTAGARRLPGRRPDNKLTIPRWHGPDRHPGRGPDHAVTGFDGKDATMNYTINRTFDGMSFKDIDARTRAALVDNGFGILTEIDVQATMKNKLDTQMPPYRILGACNPKMAYEAIGIEPRVGAMLPCNVILREVEGSVEVSAVDPVASMQAINNPELTALAVKVRGLLARTVAAI